MLQDLERAKRIQTQSLEHELPGFGSNLYRFFRRRIEDAIADHLLPYAAVMDT